MFKRPCDFASIRIEAAIKNDHQVLHFKVERVLLKTDRVDSEIIAVRLVNAVENGGEFAVGLFGNSQYKAKLCCTNRQGATPVSFHVKWRRLSL